MAFVVPRTFSPSPSFDGEAVYRHPRDSSRSSLAEGQSLMGMGPPSPRRWSDWCSGKLLASILTAIAALGLTWIGLKHYFGGHHLINGHGIPVECGEAPMDQETAFIVAFNTGYTPEQVASVCENLPAGAKPAITDMRCVIHTTCDKIQHFMLKHRPSEGFKGIIFIEADTKLKMQVPASVPVSPSSYRWNLERITEKRPEYNFRYRFPRKRGEGVHIYVLDSGIRTTHEDFEGRAVPTLETVGGRIVECSPTDKSCADDDFGHGTHCAGIAAGKISGVATKSIIHAVKVTDSHGYFQLSWAVSAIDWVRENAIRPAIISMSLDSFGGIGITSWTLDLAVHDAVREGIQVFVAAGNAASAHTSGKDACAVSPAKEPYAITVASTDKTDTRDIWSNYGSCVDIFAPGNEVVSAWYTSDSAYQQQSGTSEACPLAAGVGAVGLSEGVLQPTLASWIKQHALKGIVKDPKSKNNLLLYLRP